MQKRKIISLLLAIILITAGIALFIYPRITDRLYKDSIPKLEEKYVAQIETLKEDEDNRKLDLLYQVLTKENEKLYNERQAGFLNKGSTAETLINLRDYGFENNIFGFIEIPSINITLPIYFGASDENMRLGATQLTGTSYPIGGTNTNSVIAAHRGFYKTEMFRHIDKIKIGDKLIIRNPYNTLEYTAYKTMIIKPNEVNKLTIIDGEDMVTLISCHPFPNNYERYVVYFKRVK